MLINISLSGNVAHFAGWSEDFGEVKCILANANVSAIFTLFCFLFSVLIFSMPYKEIIVVIQAMFLGFNLILAFLESF